MSPYASKIHQFKIMLICSIIDFSHYNDNNIPHNKLHTFKYQIYINILVLSKSTCKHHISARICLEKKGHYDLCAVELMDESLNNFESNQSPAAINLFPWAHLMTDLHDPLGPRPSELISWIVLESVGFWGILNTMGTPPITMSWENIWQRMSLPMIRCSTS